MDETEADAIPDLTDAESAAMINSAFNQFVQETAVQIVSASSVYADGQEREHIALAITIVESITCGVLGALPLKPGNEAKIMKQMRDNVIKRMGHMRLLASAKPGKEGAN